MDPEIGFTLNQINRDIKREYKSLKNRIQSILLDSEFIKQSVVTRFPEYPLIPNERCGLWYVSPEDFTESCYFKSTDGHTNQWDFSTRRLILHLLPILLEKKGIVIVDSTRRGKKMPDALSKTIPIWCAVLNMFMKHNESEVLFTPPGSVSESENDRIKERLPNLVDKLRQLGTLNESELCQRFKGKILRPFWVYPGADMLNSSTDLFTGETTQEKWVLPSNENIVPLILCTASYRAQDGVDNSHGFTYVQGAADDHELWSCGLTPTMLWSHVYYFKDPDHEEEELNQYVNFLLNTTKKVDRNAHLLDILDVDCINAEISLGKINDDLEISNTLAKELTNSFSLVIILSQTVTLLEPHDSIRIYDLQSGSKRSSKDLRAALIEIDRVVEGPINSTAEQRKPILVCCNSGNDMSVGVVLMILSKNYREDWTRGKPSSVNKTIIRRHLTRLTEKLQRRNVNPSRATLNSVNSYLM
ncbi:RIT1 (YMR283C) [Zygosaccharomyces parabailii]|nr:RIT1 (YMR283C) [Zygosaccharomyces parabailii]